MNKRKKGNYPVKTKAFWWNGESGRKPGNFILYRWRTGTGGGCGKSNLCKLERWQGEYKVMGSEHNLIISSTPGVGNDTITLLKNVYATKIRSDNMEIKRDSYLEQLKKKIDISIDCSKFSSFQY